MLHPTRSSMPLFVASTLASAVASAFVAALTLSLLTGCGARPDGREAFSGGGPYVRAQLPPTFDSPVSERAPAPPRTEVIERSEPRLASPREFNCYRCSSR